MNSLPHTPRFVDGPADAPALVGALHRWVAATDHGADPLLDALLHVAARYGEILANGLDSAPDLHLDAMARLMRPPRRPQVAATTMLAFDAAPGGGRTAVVVPAHTRVAGDPLPGESAAVVFETIEDLTLVRAAIARAVLVDAGHLHGEDVGALFGAPAAAVSPTVPVALHLASPSAFGLEGLRRIELQLALAAPAASASSVDWGIEDGDDFVPLQVAEDTTQGLMRDGRVVLAAPAAGWPASARQGVVARWLTARWRAVGASVVPRVRVARIGVAAECAIAPRPPEQIWGDAGPIDAGKEFAPMGLRPRYASSWYLQSTAFAEEGSIVTLDLEIANPVDATPRIVGARIPEPVSGAGQPRLRWEILTDRGYVPIDVGGRDETKSLLESGRLSFTVPPGVVSLPLGGVRAPTVRVTLEGGRYEPSVPRKLPYEDKDDSSPPYIRRVAISASLRTNDLKVEHIVSQGALCTRLHAASVPFDLFVTPDVAGASLYLGFQGPALKDAGPQHLQWLAVPTASALSGIHRTTPAPAVRWQSCGPGGWHDLAVADGSAGFTRKGLIRLDVPDMTQRWPLSDLDAKGDCWWLRVSWPAEATLPALLALNAVAARQTERVRNEVLGSGSHRPGQVLRALRTPIVGGVQLEVKDEAGRWMPWREVEELSACGGRDEVFTLDRIDGTVRFGNGRHGRIPPVGTGNIRLARYDTGGGRHGNLPPLAIHKMRTAIPGVAGVRNPVAAAGGADAIDPTRTRWEAWSWLRHRDQAICADDYADLARLASPDVAKAWTIAGEDPWPTESTGHVRIIVIPDGPADRPWPSPELLETIQASLAVRRPPAVTLTVSGPRYVSVAVRALVRMAAGESAQEVTIAAERAMANFLHPAAGNRGRGWPPGRRPRRSDLLGVLGETPGVEGVNALQLDVEAAPSDEPCIVSPGEITVEIVR
ncbi:putative baseplate assembly protein [Ideonella sp. YS5]|uniref:putative baseplate assembly protein n=1 Tax=Ideonella sp. YS5 TaxID=3453714 RepID=UPI003EEF341F